MSTLDSSIVVVGLPTVLADLNASLFLGIWIITAYRLMITILLVSIGRVADIIGRVKMYNLGFAVFTIGSALCAVSRSVEMLIAFRLVQGLGAALLFVNSLVIVLDAFPTSELGTAIGINQMAVNAGTIVGYTLSGVMIGLFGWPSIFWINVPVGIFGTLWSHRRLREVRGKTEGQRFDYLGAALFSAALTLALLAMTFGDFRSILNEALIGVSITLFLAFLILETRVDQPVIDLSIFKIRQFTAGNLANLLNGIAFAALAFELSLYFQLVKGYTAFQAGLALIPMDLTLIVISPISGRLSDKYGGRGFASIGLALTSVALFLFSNFSRETSPASISASLALAGLGIGLFRSPNASSVMGSVPADRRGIASGVRSTILNTSAVLSVPIAITIMVAVLPYNELATIANATTLGSLDEVQLLLQAISRTFLVLAVINGLAVVASILRGPRAPTANLTQTKTDNVTSHN